MNIVRVVQVRVLLNMSPYRKEMLKPLLAGLMSSAPIAALLLLLRGSQVWLHLLLMPVFLLCYIGLLMLFRGGPEDRVVLHALREKFLPVKK